MEKQNIGNEFSQVGFLSALAKRGLITYLFGLLATLLLISVGLNVWQVKSYRETTERYNTIFQKMIERQAVTEVKIDTTLHKN